MKPILVAYTTNSGSTEEVARVVAAELGGKGAAVEMRRLEEVASLEGYSAVVVGAPMILGWHRQAVRFVKTHRVQLAQIPVAYFATAMRLTDVEMKRKNLPDVYLDPGLAAAPKNPKWLGIKERFTSVSNYLGPMLGAAKEVKPCAVAFFGGKLEIFRLKWWQALFVMAVVRAQPGDFRNFENVKKWTAAIVPKMQ